MVARKPLRLPSYDYSRAGAYFVTVCLAPRRPLLGRIAGATVEHSALGSIVSDQLAAIPTRHPGVRLDLSIVMPDHVHGIILLPGDGTAALPAVIGTFKSSSARRANVSRGTPGAPFWQRGYFDHVVRDDVDLDRVRSYIVENPMRWTVSRAQTALAANVPAPPAPGRARPGPYAANHPPS